MDLTHSSARVRADCLYRYLQLPTQSDFRVQGRHFSRGRSHGTNSAQLPRIRRRPNARGRGAGLDIAHSCVAGDGLARKPGSTSHAKARVMILMPAGAESSANTAQLQQLVAERAVLSE